MLRPLSVVLSVVAVLSSSGCCLCSVWAKNFERFECRAKQSEAKTNLRALYVAEESYFAEHERYGTLRDIGFEPGGEAQETLRYEYVLIEHSESAFEAEARGRGEMQGDLWRIDESGELQSMESVCGPLPSSRPPTEQDAPRRRPTGVIQAQRVPAPVAY